MKKILFIILFIPFLGFSQVSHKSNVVETDSLIGRTSSGFNIPYTWGPSQRYFTINDSSAHDWVYARIDERVGVSGDFWKTSGNTILDSTGQKIETLGGEFRTRLNIGNADNFGTTELVVFNDTASNSPQIGAYTIRHSNISTNFGMPSNTLFNSNNQFEGFGGARKSSQIATTSIGNIYAGKRSPTDPSSAFGALMYLDDYSAQWIDGGNDGTITRDRVVPDLGEVERLLNDTADVVRSELNARIDTTHREGIGTWKFSSDTIKTTLTNNRWELNWSDPAVADTVSINKNADGTFPQDQWTTRLKNIPDSSWILLKKDINNYYGFQVKKPEYNGNIKFYFQIIDRALKGTIQHGDITSLIIDESVRGTTGGSSGVTTFEGRSGAVVSQSGDYTASEVTNAFDKSVDDAVDIDYTPTSGGDWTDPDPTEVGGALDDLAADRITTNGLSIAIDTINLGDWNMDATQSYASISSKLSYSNLPGISQSNIIDVTCWILADATTTLFPASQRYELIQDGQKDGGADGVIVIQSTRISLTRTASDLFDHQDFDDTSYNRGWVVIIYLE